MSVTKQDLYRQIAKTDQASSSVIWAMSKDQRVQKNWKAAIKARDKWLQEDRILAALIHCLPIPDGQPVEVTTVGSGANYWLSFTNSWCGDFAQSWVRSMEPPSSEGRVE